MRFRQGRKDAMNVTSVVLSILLFAGIGKSARGSATTLTFDSLTPTSLGNNEAVPNGYGGLQWSNFYVVDGTDYLADYGQMSGYQTGVVSVKNVAINGNGTLAELSSPNYFNLNAGYLTGAWNDNLQVEIKAYSGSSLIYDTTYATHATHSTFYNFNFLNVNRVDFTASGGIPYYSSGTQFVLDNLNFTFAAPEPGSLGMLAVGALVFVGKRKACHGN